ncbi:MAG: hypothetical protein KY455_07300 [Euryarchaeota archaeon]|nr:hypothetical protein [Euryarchaeota archaeon]
MRPFFLVGVLVLGILLSGCTEAPHDTPGEPLETESGEAVIDDGTDLEKGLSVGAQPHVHDYWRGADTVILMDETLSTGAAHENLFRGVFMTMARTFITGQVPDPLYEDPGLRWTLPDGVLVYEGTGELRIELGFDGLKEAPEGLRFYYKPASQKEFIEHESVVVDGEPVLLNLSYEMADIPHSQATRWAFYVRPVDDSGVARLDGDLAVHIAGFKRFDIENAPAHPDHWANGTEEMLLMEDTRAFSYKRTLFQTEEVEMTVRFPKGVMVPPGTGTLEMWLSWEIDTAIPPIDHEMAMLMRTASDSRRGTFPEPAEEDAGSKHFVIPVDLSMVDSPYADVSAWEFDLFIMPSEDAMRPLFFAEDVSGTWTIKAVAHKDPSWVGE